MRGRSTCGATLALLGARDATGPPAGRDTAHGSPRRPLRASAKPRQFSPLDATGAPANMGLLTNSVDRETPPARDYAGRAREPPACAIASSKVSRSLWIRIISPVRDSSFEISTVVVTKRELASMCTRVNSA